MTFTYDSTDISTDLAQVRLRIGDTNSADPLLTDEEITAYLTLDSDIVGAAILCVKAIIAKLARDVDRGNLGMSATRSQKVQHYKDLLIELRKGDAHFCQVFAGGLSVSGKESNESDTDYIPPRFKLGMFDGH